MSGSTPTIGSTLSTPSVTLQRQHTHQRQQAQRMIDIKQAAATRQQPPGGNPTASAKFATKHLRRIPHIFTPAL
jgi:hypothetical protein